MGTGFDAEQDKHLDHSKENPSSDCFFCKKNDWTTEREGPSTRQKRRTESKERKLESLKEDFNSVQEQLEESFLPTVKLVNRRDALKHRIKFLEGELA